MIKESKLREWEDRLGSAQAGHYRQSEIYAGFNLFIGIPLVLLSAFVSTVLFIDPTAGSTAQTIDLCAKIAGAVVTAIVSIQTFIRPAEKAEQHRSKATKYGALKRKLEFFSSRNTGDQQAEESFIRDLEISWEAIADGSPTTPWWVMKTLRSVPNSSLRSNSNSGSTSQSTPP